MQVVFTTVFGVHAHAELQATIARLANIDGLVTLFQQPNAYQDDL